MTDPRIGELLELAREEGITLPYPADLIMWFEDRGRIVCLTTGIVCNAVIATPTTSAQAIAHLLTELEGEFRV